MKVDSRSNVAHRRTGPRRWSAQAIHRGPRFAQRSAVWWARRGHSDREEEEGNEKGESHASTHSKRQNSAQPAHLVRHELDLRRTRPPLRPAGVCHSPPVTEDSMRGPGQGGASRGGGPAGAAVPAEPPRGDLGSFRRCVEPWAGSAPSICEACVWCAFLHRDASLTSPKARPSRQGAQLDPLWSGRVNCSSASACARAPLWHGRAALCYGKCDPVLMQ